MRGKKISEEEVYKVMASYFVTGNYSETARDLGMPISTVTSIVERNKDKDEFVKLRDEKRETFIQQTDEVIELAVNRMKGMLLNDEEHIPINHLAIVFGTAFDKRALAKGETTQNVNFATNFDLDKLMSVAGYKKIEEESNDE